MTFKPVEVRVEAFVEGATEVAVLRGLEKKRLLAPIDVRAGGKGQPSGKKDLIPALRQRIGEWAKLPEGARSPLRVVVVLDQDHGTIASVVDSLREGLRVAGLAGVELAPHPQHERVYLLTSPRPAPRLSLHVAGSPSVCEHFPALSHRSMDDDVLRLALEPATAAAMLAERHESRQRLGADRLLAKVKVELPALMLANGLEPFVFAKDHIRFYGAVLGTSTSPSAFAETVVKHASPEALQATFAPLLAACNAL
jgi:hypothetical protein